MLKFKNIQVGVLISYKETVTATRWEALRTAKNWFYFKKKFGKPCYIYIYPHIKETFKKSLEEKKVIENIINTVTKKEAGQLKKQERKEATT